MIAFSFYQEKFMATKYKFCHYTFSDGSRVTNVVRNYFCQEIFLQIKFRLSVTNFFITECLFSCSGKGVRNCGHTLVCHYARDFSVQEHSVKFRTVPKPLETGL